MRFTTAIAAYSALCLICLIVGIALIAWADR